MIDVEPQIFSRVKAHLEPLYPGIFVSNMNIAATKKFPAVSIEENGNSVYTGSLDSSQEENHSMLSYIINVYCVGDARRSQARRIAMDIDAFMSSIGFVRRNMKQIPNLSDSTVCRVWCTYRSIIDNKTQNTYRG